jgi:hypothetical protein
MMIIGNFEENFLRRSRNIPKASKRLIGAYAVFALFANYIYLKTVSC